MNNKLILSISIVSIILSLLAINHHTGIIYNTKDDIPHRTIIGYGSTDKLFIIHDYSSDYIQTTLNNIQNYSYDTAITVSFGYGKILISPRSSWIPPINGIFDTLQFSSEEYIVWLNHDYYDK